MAGVVDNDAASSAQSKRVDGEMARLWGVWGELGHIGGERGRSDGSGSVSCRFWVFVRGPGWGRRQDSVVVDGRVDGDVAVVPCTLREMGDGGMCCGVLGQLLDRR